MKSNKKKLKAAANVVPFAEETIEERPDPIKHLETGITQADVLKLSEFSYFLQSVIDAFQAWDSKVAELKGMTASALLRPMADDFHHFVHVTLDDARESWDIRDRREGLELVTLKTGKLAREKGGAA